MVAMSQSHPPNTQYPLDWHSKRRRPVPKQDFVGAFYIKGEEITDWFEGPSFGPASCRCFLRKSLELQLHLV